jgi:hypothetical protein
MALDVPTEYAGEKVECWSCNKPFIMPQIVAKIIDDAPPSLPQKPTYQSKGRPNIQTIERTSKSYKGMMLIGMLISTGGIVGCVAGLAGGVAVLEVGGLLSILLGIFVFCIARIGAWWHNG